MKSFAITLGVSVLFFLASCKASVFQSVPVTEKAPDTLSKPTVTVVPKDTKTEMAKGSWVKTDPDEKTTVLLEEDTQAFIKPQPANPGVGQISEKQVETVIKPQEIILPKNTEVILPGNTYLQTSDQATVVLEAGSEVTLPIGTEISITKINWYAVLFYSLILIGLAWYYLQHKKQPEDQNGDGIVDDDKYMAKKKFESAAKKPVKKKQ